MISAHQFLATILSLVLFFSPYLAAQAPQKPAPQQPAGQKPASVPQLEDDPRNRIRVTTELVVVPVTVKDGHGNAVLDLNRTEFRILEDGVEQEISVFSQDPFPLSVVILIDNGLPRKAAEQVQRSAAVIASGLSEFDEASVMLFDAFPSPPQDFTTDNDKIYQQLKRTELNSEYPGRGSGPMTSGPRINSQSQTTGVPQSPNRDVRSIKHLDDAIYAAGELLKKANRERRKIIFLISDGVNSRGNKNTYEDTVRLLLSADVSVYAIGVGDAPLNRGMNPLSRYAHATGGDVFYSASREDLENLCTRVTEQARNQYTLAYIPRGTDRKRDYHDIEVKVRRGGLNLLARQGYFVPLVP